MTARSRMTQRALVERFTAPTDVDGNVLLDDTGNPLPPSWATHLAAMPIWLYGSTEREAVTEETTAVVTDLKAMAPLTADVTEQDRIQGVKDRRGTVIEAGLLHIETVLYQRSHKALTLSRVSG